MSLRNRREIRIGGRRYVVTSWNEEPTTRYKSERLFASSERETLMVLKHAGATHTDVNRLLREGRSAKTIQSKGFRVWEIRDQDPPQLAIEEPTKDPAPEQEPSWIAFQIMDDDDPAQPMANFRVKVKTPNGREILTTTDNNGYLRIDGINPGQCEVTFPDIDDSDGDVGEDKGKLVFRLPIDPADAKSRDDKFTLTALNDSGFKQEKTVKDDAKAGDKCVDLIFEDLDTTDFYTLTIDPGAEGEPYVLRHPEGWKLEDVSYNVLSALMRGQT